MQHPKNAKGGWARAVLGLCALAVIAGVYRASQSAESPVEAGSALSEPILSEPVVVDQEPQEVSLPVALPSLPAETDREEHPEDSQTEEEPIPVAAPRVIVSPLEGETVSAFSADALQYNDTLADWRTHDGLDIAAAAGTEVLAACAGTVESVTENDLLGKTVVIDHGDGCKTIYASLSDAVSVRAGDSVRAGQAIGAVGNSALSETALGPHLHFAVLQDEEPTDPEAFLAG